MDDTMIGDVRLSRLLLGSNPFSGFSHQGTERDERDAPPLHAWHASRRRSSRPSALGVTALVARTDFHVMRMLLEYRDEGGKLAVVRADLPGGRRTPRPALAGRPAEARSPATSTAA